jgi:hypothetical protein
MTVAGDGMFWTPQSAVEAGVSVTGLARSPGYWLTSSCPRTTAVRRVVCLPPGGAMDRKPQARWPG